ncbi:MAG: hypothetical protein HYT93_02540 [Parcubacteria group bacterium]|nr:hypothetical protein [Parcubacteria group bacterium]
MEKLPKNPTGAEIQEFVSKQEAELKENLNSLVELFNLKVLREGHDFSSPILVVEAADGGEAKIGFPDGLKYPPCATKKIKDVPMSVYGHGPWAYHIDI